MKIFKIICAISTCTLISCGRPRESINNDNTYTIIWENYNGTILETDSNVKLGSMPSYDGATPTRSSEGGYSYTFIGWSPEVAPVTGDATYTALYSKTEKTVKLSIEYTLYNPRTDSLIESFLEKPSEIGNVSTSEVYNCNTYVDLFSEPNDGYTFVGWFYDGLLLSDELNYKYRLLDKDVTIEARFKYTMYNLHVFSNNEENGLIYIDNSQSTSSYLKEDTTSQYYNESVTIFAYYKNDVKFLGWYDENNQVISEDPIYSFKMPAGDYSLEARFLSKAEEEAEAEGRRLGIIPTISEYGKVITYGLYPQTYVNDSTLISSLNELTTRESNGWYLFEGEYYAKQGATPYKDSVFNNGDPIVKNNRYWFKCEPITWNILSNNDGEYYIVSSVLLENHSYSTASKDKVIDGQTIHPNNYKHSFIRKWLNEDFYNSAFALGNEYIQVTTVDNSASTTDISSNIYACENTEDKVFLPSYQDYINSSYGFSTSSDSTFTRYCKTTDWARASGAYSYSGSSNLYNDGHYWTRSPCSGISDYAWCVYYNGVIRTTFDNSYQIGVRPGLTIKIA